MGRDIREWVGRDIREWVGRDKQGGIYAPSDCRKNLYMGSFPRKGT